MPVHPTRLLQAGAILALTLAALPGDAGAARKATPGAAWLPVVSDGEGIRMEGERVTLTDSKLVLEVERLDDAKRAIFMRSAGLGERDPFVSETLGLEALTFLIRLDNRTSETIVLRPQNFFIITRKPTSHNTPCDYSCLVAAAERAGFDPAGARRLLSSVLDASETVRPGGRMSKLLVFTRAPESFRDFVLDLDMISIGSEQVRFVIPYAIPKEKKK